MMTHANAATTDAVAAAQAIAENARRKANRTEDTHGMAAVTALAAGVILSLAAVAFMATSPALISSWCAMHVCPIVAAGPHLT